MDHEPKWTVSANLVRQDTRWVGESWEFFEDEATAQSRYDELSAQGHCPTKRPFHRGNDFRHMHVLDQVIMNNKVEVSSALGARLRDDVT